MSRHIPFVNTQQDCDFLKRYYMDSKIVRVSLENIESIKDQIPSGVSLWMDPGVDGYEHHLRREEESLPAYLRQFREYNVLASQSTIARPVFGRLMEFVRAVLNRCRDMEPAWITVPQLPLVDGTSRNKINAALAKATYEWKLEVKFKGRLVLPLILTNKRQIEGKTKWKPRVDSAIKWRYVTFLFCPGRWRRARLCR